MSKRLVLITLIAALLLTACGGGMGDSPPAMRLIVNGEAVEGLQGSYCWNRLCADMVPPVFDSSHTLVAGEAIQFELDRPLPDTLAVNLGPEVFGESVASDSLDGAANVEWNPTVAPGTYILSIAGKWSDGSDASYFFSVTIQ